MKRKRNRKGLSPIQAEIVLFAVIFMFFVTFFAFQTFIFWGCDNHGECDDPNAGFWTKVSNANERAIEFGKKEFYGP